MALSARLSILFLLLIVFTSISSTSSASRPREYIQRELRKARRDVNWLRSRLALTRRNCLTRRRNYFNKARQVRGCPFARRNGLQAVYRMRALCRKRPIRGKYARFCWNKPRSCRRAEWFVKRGEWLGCEQKIAHLKRKLWKAIQRVKYLEGLLNPKPSNEPRFN